MAVQKKYTIKKGDTLSAIARRNGTTVAKLAAANNIKNPDLILAGAQLNLGGKAADKPTSPKKMAPSKKTASSALGGSSSRAGEAARTGRRKMSVPERAGEAARVGTKPVPYKQGTAGSGAGEAARAGTYRRTPVSMAGEAARTGRAKATRAGSGSGEAARTGQRPPSISGPMSGEAARATRQVLDAEALRKKYGLPKGAKLAKWMK